MPKRRNRSQPSTTDTHKKSDFMEMLGAFFCMSPKNSPASPTHNQPLPGHLAALSAPLLHQFKTQQTLPAKVEQNISEAEWAEREEIKKAFFHGHSQLNEVESLFFYAVSAKLLCMQNDFETYTTAMQQNLCDIHTLMRFHLVKQEAFDRAEISRLALAEYTELKTLFEDDKAALVPGNDFDHVSSSSRFFKPTSADTTANTSANNTSWFGWLRGL